MATDPTSPLGRGLAWSVWSIYALIVLLGIAQGGMWLDEMQVWCLAHDTDSWSTLLFALRNEGHPPLWPILVRLVTFLTDAPMAMAMLHGAFALGTSWIILFRAPWPLLWRVLAVSGHFVLFEYAVIARNYGPGMFFLFAALLAYKSGRPRLAMVAFMALAMTHYWGIVIAASWGISTIVSGPRERSEIRRSIVLLITAGLALGLAWPAAKLAYAPDLQRLSEPDLVQTIGRMLVEVFIPFPDLSQERLWGTSWWSHMASSLAAISGGLLLAGSIFSLGRERRWLLFFLTAAIGILAFPALAPFRSVRYVGPLFLALLSTHWMRSSTLIRPERHVLLVLLCLQVPGGLLMTWAGLHRVRSQASASVEWLCKSPYAAYPVIVHPCQVSPAVSGYLGRPVYSLAMRDMVSFNRWDAPRCRLSREDLRMELSRSPFEQAVLIADDSTLVSDPDGPRLTKLHSTPGAMIKSEEHHLYLVERPQ